MKLSFGVASCARISSARMPPTPKKPSAVTMYRIPIRLWSTVTSQLAARPLFHVTGTTASDLTATCRSLVDVLFQIRLEGAQLSLGPVVRDGRHPAASLAHDRLEPGALREQGVRRERRPIVALTGQAVALGADALPLPLSELPPRRRPHPRLVVGVARDDCLREHPLVVEAAELGALALVRSDRLRLVPRRVDPAGDRVRLAAELRDPPALSNVRRGDRNVRGPVRRALRPLPRAD